ncbi:MAG TPA: UDP-N-acetylmuramate dehydrogenase [Candidatus Hungatella pullicola]|nr:UDP-N-acetylmuramate dehydrogenase [Candidatus Hungatella pullicola]
MTEFYKKLVQAVGKENVKTEEAMKNHTTFRVGGPAAYYVSPSNAAELGEVIRLCREEGISWFVLGNGSNLLVGDQGFDGVILSMTEGFSWCEADPETGRIRAGSGTILGTIARAAMEASLTGLEFASGIPGTLGGAVVMNAGAYGAEMCQVLEWVKVMTQEGEEKILACEELELGYRTSCILRKGYIVTEASLKLAKGDREEILTVMRDLAARRKAKQPLEYPSAGSTFKRPEGYFAGKLIDEAGLRGFCVGGAQVSEKHCGFVINRNQASASDIMELCRQVRERVRERFGVELEMEVKVIGNFPDAKEIKQ